MVSLTRRAAEMVRANKDGKRYLRVFLNPGVPVPDYTMEFTDQVHRDDIMYLSYGIKIIVGSKTRKLFENLKIDYSGQNGSGKFDFHSEDAFTIDM